MAGNAVPPRLAKAVALSISRALDDVVQRKNNILVAYYRNEQQLTRCEKLSLFYFRANLDGSAYNPLICMPPYLLLVNGKRKYLYELDNDVKPTLATKGEIQKLGFTPHYGLYWSIRLGKKITFEINYEAKWNDKRKRPPYLEWMDLENKS